MQIKHRLQAKTVQNNFNITNMWVDLDVKGQEGMDFFTGESSIID